jgi:catechol 2,3-dioxygenase-like lactoylglutathione lyase family enzyme
MGTIDHVTIRVTDLAAARGFYERAFELLGFGGQRHEGDLGVEWADFSISEADAERPPTEGLHILHCGLAGACRQLVAGNDRRRLSE